MNAHAENPNLAAALEYAAQGWPVFPCSAVDKKPLVKNGFKEASKDPEKIAGWWRRFPDAAIAVPTGPGTGFVLDLDIGDPQVITGAEYLARFEEYVGELPTTAVCETGSGGYHLWFQWDPEHPVTNGANIVPILYIPPTEATTRSGKKPKGAQIDVRGMGGYALVPPTVRSDGGIYSWCPGPDDGIARATERVLQIALKLDLAAERASKASTPPQGGAEPPGAGTETDYTAVRRYALAALNNEASGLAAAPAGERNAGLNRAAYLLGRYVGAGALTASDVRAALEDACRRNGLVQDDGLTSVRKTIASGFGSGIANPKNLSEVRERAERKMGKTSEPKITRKLQRRADTAGEESDWRGLLQIGKRYCEPKANLLNTLIALRNAPEWHGVLAYDTFGLVVVLRQPPPWHRKERWAQRPWSPLDTILTTEWLQRQGINVGLDVTHSAVDAVAQESPFHPVRDYLDALRWDGCPRVDNWLRQYVGVEPSRYESAVGRCFLISAVARIYEPGCKADQMLLLEGNQGIHKSSAVKVLGGEWFCADLPDIGTKDACLALSGRWIFEVEELNAMSRADSNTIKKFVSHQVDRFRRPYGTQVEEVPRQCVFIGTTNKTEYLDDATGGRRFWPVRAGTIDLQGLARDRDQIWAEAVHLYKAGELWWITDSEILVEARAEQTERRIEAPWEMLIGQYIEPLDSVSISEILTACISKPKEQWRQSDFNQVADILTSHGWQKYRANIHGRRENRYRKRAAEQPT